MPRRMWTSSSLSRARLASRCRRAISFFGAAGSRKPSASSEVCQCAQDPAHGDGVGLARVARARRDRKAAERLAPLVGDQLHRLRQVERAVARVGGDREAGVARVHVLVRQAVALRAEHEPDPLRRRGQGREQLARRVRRRPEIARRHRRRADVGEAIERILEAGDDAGARQHVGRAARQGDRLGAALHVGETRRHQHEVGEAHHLQRARRRADIARVAGADEDEAGEVGRHAAAKIAVSHSAARPNATSARQPPSPSSKACRPCPKRCTPCSTPPSRRRARPARSSTAPRSTSSGCR